MIVQRTIVLKLCGNGKSEFFGDNAKFFIFLHNQNRIDDDPILPILQFASIEYENLQFGNDKRKIKG